MATRAEVVGIPDKYLAALSAKDVDGIMALYADDPVVEDPVGSDPKVGRDAVRAFYESTTSVNLTATRIGPVMVAADRLAFQFRIDVDLGDNTIAVGATDVMTFDDAGRVTAMMAIPDSEAFAE